MFHLVQTWSSRLAGNRADDRMLLALSGVDEASVDRRVRACMEQLRRSLVARRQVEVCMARAVAMGRGRGRSEERVRARIGRGLSRVRQLEVLAEDHEAAMAQLMDVHAAFKTTSERLARRPELRRRSQGLLDLCQAEERAFQDLLCRYADDRLEIERLHARWSVLAGSRAA